MKIILQKMNFRHRRYKFLARLGLICLMVLLSAGTAFASSKLKIKYDKKTVYYTNSQLKVTMDGTSVDLKKTPGLTISKTNMVSYYDVFYKGLCAETIYNKKSKVLTIKQNGKTIKMTVGKKTAYVNGKKKSLSAAPKVIYFYSTKSYKVYVPVKFVATQLGYTYKVSNGTVALTTPKGLLRLYYDSKWNSYTGTQAQVTVNGNSINIVSIPGIIINNTTLLPASKVFTSGFIGAQYTYNKLTKEVTISKDNTSIVFILNSKSAYVNGVKKQLDTAPRIVKNKANGKANVMIPAGFTATNLGYSYYWNSVKKTSVITTTSTTTTGTGTNSDTNLVGRSLTIMQPQDVLLSAVTSVDDYLNLRFVITVPGNRIDYYNQNPIVNSSSSVTQVSTVLNVSGNTEIVVSTNAIKGYKLIQGEGCFHVIIDDPNKIYKNIVVLDPGHGDSKPGATYNNVKEKSVVYNILYTYANTYFNGINSSVKAYWTRINDTDLTKSKWYKSVTISNISSSDSSNTKELKARAALSKYVQADLFISLHLNASSSASASGLEAFSSNLNTNKTASNLTSVKLAKYFADNLSAIMGMTNRGNKEYTYLAVCRYNPVPAILIELGFMTNPSDFNKQISSAYQLKAAESIFNLTQQVFLNYPTGR